ncbi:hypothetical protein ACPPVQ_02545 [Diaminobutyricibacter sp. McL0618]|uniref:hypothetical protein n=1 Tax=Leifsonia sp. McL0618 TaxID=3415677 RepID=UPI003CEF3559
MARHAGFATAATITERFVDSAIESYLGEYLAPLRFPMPPSITIAGTTVAFDGWLQLLAPTVELHPNPDDLVRTHFGFTGAMSAGVNTPPSQVVTVELDVTVDCRFVSTVADDGQVTVGLDTSTVAFQPLVMKGSPIPPEIKDALESAQLADLLTGFVRSLSPIVASPPLLNASIRSSRPTPAGALASLFEWFTIDIVATDIVVKVLEHAVTVGVDARVVDSISKQATFETHGDENALVDLTVVRGPGVVYTFTIDEDTDPKEQPILTSHQVSSGGSMASTTNLAFLTAVVDQISRQISGTWVSANVRINSISLGYTTFDKEFRGRQDALALNFDLTIAPGNVGVTGRFLIQPYETVWAQPRDRSQSAWWRLFITELDVDTDWWQEAALFTLTVFFGALVPVVGPILALAEIALIADLVPTLLANVENQVVRGLDAPGNQFSFPRLWNKPLPGLSQPNWQGQFEYVSANADGVDLAIGMWDGFPDSQTTADESPSMLNSHSGELIQGTWGQRGNFELVVPQGERIVHYARMNDAPAFPWIHVADLPLPHLLLEGDDGQVAESGRVANLPMGVSLIQSTFNAPENPGNFELAVRMRDALHPGDDQADWLASFYFDSVARSWRGPFRITLGDAAIGYVSGDPALIQSTWGGRPGNFELVVPQGDRLVHYSRLNDRDAHPWLHVADLPVPALLLEDGRGHVSASGQAGAIALGVALIESNFNTPGYPGNLELVVRFRSALTPDDAADDWLAAYYFDSIGRAWSGPHTIAVGGVPIRGVTGDPTLIQSTWGGPNGNFELVVPRGDRLTHYARFNDQPGFPWAHLSDLPLPALLLEGGHGTTESSQPGVIVLGASLIQSTFNTPDNPGNFELAARFRSASTPDDTDNDWLAFYTLDSISRTWNAPRTVSVNGQPVTGLTGF